MKQALKASALLLGLVLIPNLAYAAGHTIVGTWAPDPRECSSIDGLVSIGPLDMMMGDEFRCSFRDVSRSGEIVTWHGSCGMPEQPKDNHSTVVAELRGKLLYVRLNGGQNGPYLRCTPE